MTVGRWPVLPAQVTVVVRAAQVTVVVRVARCSCSPLEDRQKGRSVPGAQHGIRNVALYPFS